MKKIFQVSFLLAFVPFAYAGPKLAKDLPGANSNAAVDVIVQFKTPPTKNELKQFGAYGQVKKTFNSIKAIHVTVSASVLTALEADPNVKYVSPNRRTKGFLDLSTAAVNASVAW